MISKSLKVNYESGSFPVKKMNSTVKKINPKVIEELKVLIREGIRIRNVEGRKIYGNSC